MTVDRRITTINRADRPPLIVAEMSGNHNQSLERALSIVDAAAESGADAVKLQTYTADTMTLPLRTGDFLITDEESPWHGKTLYELYEEAHTPWDWHKPIFERCRRLGIHCFSTPFDTTAVAYLEDLGIPAYKIASFEITDLRLVREVARTGKPLIISTGMASVGEIADAVDAARSEGNRDITLLKCTSTYPATPENTNLRTIPILRDTFATDVGLSDHTPGIGAAVASVALGATLIEKHFTLSRADGGVDAAFSLEPNELRSLVEETRRAWQALGSIRFGPSNAERGSLQFRRSLYITKNTRAGEPLTPNNVRAIRPGYGLSPKHLPEVLGMRIHKDAPEGTPLTWELLRSAPET